MVETAIYSRNSSFCNILGCQISFLCKNGLSIKLSAEEWIQGVLTLETQIFRKNGVNFGTETLVKPSEIKWRDSVQCGDLLQG